MKHNPIILMTLLLGLTLFGCKKYEPEKLTPKITEDKVEATATTATFTWTVDWPGKLISVVEVSENEDMSHSQIYGSETETENHNFSVIVTNLKEATKYYYRYLVWNKFYVDNKFALEKKSFCIGCVDLGLPSGTLWATCNVGANTPEEYGNSYAWGEIQPKNSYNWSTYKYSNSGSWENSNLIKYCNNPSCGYNGFTDNLTTLEPEDDVTTANWGNGWRMPTKVQWEELINNTTVTRTTQNGVKGEKFTASNGNSLFLPAAGYRNGGFLYYDGSNGYYWSSSLNIEYPDGAWYLYFYSDDCIVYSDRTRWCGRSVRAVSSASQN